MVGCGGRVAHASVSSAPYAAVVNVPLTVIRLRQDVVLHAIAVTKGVLDGQVVIEIMLKRKGRDIRAGFAEITVSQAVEVTAVAAVVRFVRACCGMGFTHRVAIRNT